MRLDIGIISHTCRKWQALLLEEVLDLGSLVVCASVNHIVADKFLLAVACKGTVSHAKQFAQVVVIQQCIASYEPLWYNESHNRQADNSCTIFRYQYALKGFV